MAKASLSESKINPARLRTMSLIAVSWIVFISLIPDFFMRISGHPVPWISAVSWGIGILLISLLSGYLCLIMLREKQLTRLVFWGILLLVFSQSYRIAQTLGLFEMLTLQEWRSTMRGFDNLLNGLGLVMIGLAFVYMVIEMLASRQRLLEERTGLSAEVARREKLERSLRERDALLQGINASALDGIIAMDNAGRVTYWNPAAERILGHGAEEMIGKSVHEILAPAHHRPAYTRGLAEWKDTGQGPVVGQVTALKALAKDGSEVDVELSVSSMKIAGQWHAVSILRDISQRKKSEQEYSTILHTAMDGFWIVNKEGRILDVNEAYCAMTGYAREELLDMSIPDLEAVESATETAAHIQKIEEKGYDRFETRHKRKDGAIIDVEISANLNVSGQEGREYVFIRDITDQKRLECERKELEAQIQHSQKLEGLGVLAGGIAHDFNNILQIILGNVNMLEKETPGTSYSQGFIDSIKRSVDRASSLTGQMLAYSGRRSGILRFLNLDSIVEGVVSLIQSSVSKKITLQLNIMNDLPFIEADEMQIEQVVMNLIQNAAEALDEKEGGVVSIATKVLPCTKEYLHESRALYKAPEGNYVCLEVTDAGCGMNRETRDKLFDPFFSTKFTGRGLGMSAVLGIVSAHKGAIIVDSVVGKGTTIRVLFPLSSSSVTDAGNHTMPPKQVSMKEKRTVLLVDDEPDVLAIGSQMLEQLGCTVCTASDGVDAVALFEKQAADIDCVLLDLSMPRMDGIQTLMELRQIKPEVRVILATGYSEQSVESRLTGQDIRAFLKKPFDAKNLAETLTEVLS